MPLEFPGGHGSIFVYQELSARENLLFWGSLSDLPKSQLKANIDLWLERVGLTERAREPVAKFSGGMKRRLNLAVGLVHHPKVVLLDEPTVGIDPQARKNILDIIRQIAAEGATILFTTHHLEEAEGLRLVEKRTVSAFVVLPENLTADLLTELAKPPRLRLETRRHFSLRLPPSGFAFTLPAYLVMFTMMMTIMYGGMTLVLERSQKRIRRLVAAPVSGPEIFLGKMLGRMLQPALQGGLLIAAGVTLFGVNLGDHPSALVPVVLCFAFFCGALGLLFGVVFRTEQQVGAFGILATMVLAARGGCWWPLEVVPQTFKTIALFTPSYWALQGFQDVMSFGKSWLDVLPECAILAGLGAAIPLFRWE